MGNNVSTYFGRGHDNEWRIFDACHDTPMTIESYKAATVIEHWLTRAQVIEMAYDQSVKNGTAGIVEFKQLDIEQSVAPEQERRAMTIEENAGLLNYSRQQLKHWFDLAKLADTHGVPVDLIYLKCRSENALPVMIEKLPQGSTPRPVSMVEFQEGLDVCIKMLQRKGGS